MLINNWHHFHGSQLFEMTVLDDECLFEITSVENTVVAEENWLKKKRHICRKQFRMNTCRHFNKVAYNSFTD
jgi:hypothetical protein